MCLCYGHSLYSAVVARAETRNMKNTRKNQYLVTNIYCYYAIFLQKPNYKWKRSGGLAKKNKRKDGARASHTRGRRTQSSPPPNQKSGVNPMETKKAAKTGLPGPPGYCKYKHIYKTQDSSSPTIPKRVFRGECLPAPEKARHPFPPASLYILTEWNWEHLGRGGARGRPGVPAQQEERKKTRREARNSLSSIILRMNEQWVGGSSRCTVILMAWQKWLMDYARGVLKSSMSITFDWCGIIYIFLCDLKNADEKQI